MSDAEIRALCALWKESMRTIYQGLLKHSAIYGIGQVLSRLASVLLLPVYTSYLTLADYGVIAILDFFAGILAILIGAGMGRAATRFHFEAKDESERSQVWWTGLAFVVVVGMGFLLVAMLCRDRWAGQPDKRILIESAYSWGGNPNVSKYPITHGMGKLIRPRVRNYSLGVALPAGPILSGQSRVRSSKCIKFRGWNPGAHAMAVAR